MNNSTRPTSVKIGFTAAASAFEAAHLWVEYLNGGVLSHHLLANPDLPAISNWWGLVVIPVLTWFLVGRIQSRVARQNAFQSAAPRIPSTIMIAFTAALAYGAALSFAFVSNFEWISAVFLGAFAVALVVPVYRAEYLLGFVLGMTFTFGAVLPLIIGAVIAVFSRLVHLAFSAAVRLIRNQPVSRAQ
ncbi:hypothetical protein [Pseudoduganella sp. GCM10020061]|uniref:hypothetical protein n=1 Tax=Pseudoduganella sp. GCM10020061 TaxID=3317345 RepID=UPI00362A2F13